MINLILKTGFTLFLVTLTLLSFQSAAYAQQANGEKFSTQATDPNAKPDARKMGPKEKKILYIIKNNPWGTLYGNPCFKEESHKFGFEYLVAPEGLVPNRTGFSRGMHNLGVNIILFFRNGPCWKLRMKKKLRHCKYGYGDYVG